jgi:CheY-like chemotaxis protein
MSIYGLADAEKTKPNKANSNPILAQNWLRFSPNWLCLDGWADQCGNCQDGRKIRLLADRSKQANSYKTLSDKQLAGGCPAKKALAQNLHICRWLLYRINVMAGKLLEPENINVLASAADWAWPEALHDIFEPRGITLMVAGSADEFVNVLRHRRIHAAIIDIGSEAGGLTTIKIIKMDYPRLPCLLLKARADEQLLGKALELDVFSVLDKPIDMAVLQQQLNRLFIKYYNSNIFA